MTFSRLIADGAVARVGAGNSLGSRGGQTFNAPPSTKTMPKTAARIERTMTPLGTRNPAVTRSVARAAPSRLGGTFGVVAGGVVGAVMFGLLWSAVSAGSVSDLGPVFQFALIGAAAWLVLSFLRARKTPLPARADSDSPIAAARGALDRFRQTLVSNGGFAASGPAALALKSDDFDRFAELLQDIQRAYGRDNSFALGAMTTPEMFSYASQDLAESARTGTRSEISGVNLLQGDLCEAWHEAGSDYATLAMRFALIPGIVPQGNGPIVPVDRKSPVEVTEAWTFRRDDRDREQGWQLSAIQQVEGGPPRGPDSQNDDRLAAS